MFKKRSLLIGSIIFFATCLTSIKIFYISKRNQQSYCKTLEYLQPTVSNQTGTTKRNTVTKNLWVQGEDTLYQYIISSKGSTLHLNQLKASETKVVENMEYAVCLLQQKLYYVDQEGNEIKKEAMHNDSCFPRQQVCRLEVDHGTFNYMSKSFSGDQTKIQIYEIPGHELTATPHFHKGKKMMEGNCDHIKFYFMEKIPNLKVENLVAKIFAQGEDL